MVAMLEEEGTPVVSIRRQQHQWVAHVTLARLKMKVPVDFHGVAIWQPVERSVPYPDCVTCARLSTCRQLSPAAGTAAM